MKYWILLTLSLCATLLGPACQREPGRPGTDPGNRVFTRLPAAETGLDFTNRLVEDGQFDVFRYRNYYNGGGVAIGDLNNDGLPDVYLTSNCAKNQLFLNKGNFSFENVTETAGVGGTRAWSTGVAMADVNADGWLDIYVCNSGNVQGDDQLNELFINNGGTPGQPPTFTEKAAEYGLADEGFGTHAVFFDYDLDGDLDCYLLNNSFRPVATLGETNIRNQRDPKGGHKLYRNDSPPRPPLQGGAASTAEHPGGHERSPSPLKGGLEGAFVDVSEQAGIYGSVIGFGLGVTVGDVNLDGYPDLYVSNDFHERDYFYLNNRDGTFREQLPDYFDQISLSSMGADLADLNNDGLPEIFSTDMLPRDDRRLKLNTTFQNYDIYKKRLQLDYYKQFTSNMLHLHAGLSAAGELLPFAEVGELAGVEATDWSWGALMADFDNDSRREILVCNGIYKDVTNQDFLNFLSSDKNLDAALRGEKADFKQWIDKIPSEKIPNYLFTRRDSASLRFTDVAADWGLGEPSYSNGAAYGDLDGDGDLDLVINNVNQELFVYRNETNGRRPGLRVRFEGEGRNPFGIGALLYLYRGGEILSYEHYPMRGFQSSMDYTAVIGLGAGGPVDSAVVWWPGGKRQALRQLPAEPLLTLRAADAAPGPGPGRPALAARPLLRDLTAGSGLRFRHQENPFSDFDREQMLYTMRSTEGPALAVGDLNGDGLEDLFLGGAKDQAGAVFVQKRDGAFTPSPQPALLADRAAEDVAAAFFDADGDGDQDLYVAGGGSEFYDNTALLQGRLYLNAGGRLTRAADRLPVLNNNGSCVRPYDYDADGDLDLFLGSRGVPGYFPQAADSYLLENDGQGRFTDVSRQKASGLRKLGLVTDAAWSDTDGDGRADLVVVGEFMPVTVFRNEGGRLTKGGAPGGLEHTEGWWTRITPADLDGDGDTDFVLGNIGENTRFRATPSDPLTLHAADFDRNGTLDQIYSYRSDGKSYPMTMLHDLVKRLPFLKKRFLLYSEYAGKTLEEVFKPEELQEAVRLEAHTLSTTLYINEGGGRFSARPLPEAAQIAPVYGIAVEDFDADGKTDLLLTGNFFAAKPELGQLSGNYGLLLTGDGRNNFRPRPAGRTGVFTRQQVRHAAVLKPVNGLRRVVLAQNDAPVLLWGW